MYMMMQNYINPFGNPFCGCSSGMNFLMGLTAGLTGTPLPITCAMPVMPCYNYYTPSVFSYSSNYTSNPFGSYSSYTYSGIGSASAFSYTPAFGSVTCNTRVMPSMPTFGIGTISSSTTVTSEGSSSSETTTGASASSSTGTKMNKKANGYGKEFLNKVKEIAKRLNCDYKDLIAVMNSESGINSKAVNKNGGATGLIQFLPTTAASLGTSTEALKNMTPIQQLDYVEKYIKQAKRNAGFADTDHLSGGQLYVLIFLPARAKREVLTTSTESYYKANKGLDTNKDGKITKSELDARVRAHYVSDNSFLA